MMMIYCCGTYTYLDVVCAQLAGPTSFPIDIHSESCLYLRITSSQITRVSTTAPRRDASRNAPLNFLYKVSGGFPWHIKKKYTYSDYTFPEEEVSTYTAASQVYELEFLLWPLPTWFLFQTKKVGASLV